MGQSNSCTTMTIEYVANHFERVLPNLSTEPVLLLASMKLRETRSVNPLQELQKVHTLASELGLAPAQYVAALYCCADTVQCQMIQASPEFLPGSLLVPAETLQNVLRPFGMSYLVQIIKEKSLCGNASSSLKAAAEET